MSRIFVGQKKLHTEKNHICGTFWTDVAVPKHLKLFFFLPQQSQIIFAISMHIQSLVKIRWLKWSSGNENTDGRTVRHTDDQCDTQLVGWGKGVVYLTPQGHPTDIGLQLGKDCNPCSRWHSDFFFYRFLKKISLCRWFTWNVKTYISLTFSEKLKKEIKMQPATNFVWHFKG